MLVAPKEATNTSELAHLERDPLELGAKVYEPHLPIERVLFPIVGAVSVVTEMHDGSSVEVGFVGREGMTGLPIVLGSDRAAHRALVQLPGAAMSMTTAAFQSCIDVEPELRAVSLRYAQATIVSVSQFAACNKLHQTSERCARWLLMAHDRVPDDTVLLTQLFLSQMLGVRRAGVTVAALKVQSAGFIDYEHGRIQILDSRRAGKRFPRVLFGGRRRMAAHRRPLRAEDVRRNPPLEPPARPLAVGVTRAFGLGLATAPFGNDEVRDGPNGSALYRNAATVYATVQRVND